ncbi:MAG: ABC transporter ATP-binding protein [Dehalococcoidia bacterium]
MLRLENITLGYGRQIILRGINLDVEQGEMVGIIGPNGSGKSTLIKGICRLLKPETGRVLIAGEDIAHLSRGELARLVAVVPQTPVLPDTFTAFEIVLMGRTPYLGRFRFEGMTDFDIAWKAMEITNTREIAERRMDEISGGQKQLLTIARALTQEPELILLDEPTAHLDINYQVETLDFVKRLCKERNLSAVAVLHDLNLAAQYCDRLVLLSHGGIHAAGSPEKVITQQNIKEVYGANVGVYPHPVNRLPTTVIIPDTGEEINT